MPLSPDNVFGPKLLGQFDFTLLFEQAMLSIVPAGVVIFAIPFYLKLAMQAPPRVRAGFLLWLKLVVGVSIFAIHSASLVMWQRASVFHSDLSLPAAVMSLVSSACIIVILYVAHTYSLRPSGFLSVFLTITILFDITMTRSYSRRVGFDVIEALQIVVILLKSCLVIFEEIPKRKLFIKESMHLAVSKETAAGFWNRAVFGWLNSLLVIGFRRELTIDDLPAIDEELQSMRLFDRFLPKWKRQNKKSGFALAKAIMYTLAWECAKIILPRLMFVGLTFAQPFLVFSVIHAINGELGTEESDSLIYATAIIFGGKAIARSIYEHLIYRIMTSTRGLLVVAIFDKTQRLSSEELEKSAAITLMTSGTTAIEQLLSLTYEIWSCSLQVGLGVFSLNLYVGPACYLMLPPGIVSFIASRYIGQAMGKARAAWNLEMEGRVAATSNVLAQIKAIKATGLSGVMAGYLQGKRRKEVQVSLKERNTRIWLFAFAAISHTLPPICVLAGAIFWTRASDPLDVAEIFTVIAIILVAAEPFRTLLTSLVSWSSGLASLRRIQEFLCMEEIRETRRIPDSDTDEAAEHDIPGEKQMVISPESRESTFAVQFDRVSVSSLVMGPILKDVSLCIPWGDLAILWGSIACGKSTLLRCVLGETKLDSGTVSVGTKSVGYCKQLSWTRNQTIRENIIGVLAFVEAWYYEVITACGLDVDIAALIKGDQTMTGTGGCNLSGGQKQRVSLARAIYVQTDILVIDDVFSALDPATAQRVFSNLFGPEGLVRSWGCTVILTTNHLEFLDDADLIYQLHRGGRLEQQQVELTENNETAQAGQSEDDESSDDEDAMPIAPVRAAEPPSVKSSPDDQDLENAREKKKYGEWSLYRYYLGAAGAFTVTFWISFVALCAVVEQSPSIFIKLWYAKDALNENYFYGYITLCIVNIIFNTLNGVIFFHRVLPKCSEEMHLRLTKAVLFASPHYLGQTDIGKLLNRFGQDIFLTSQYLPITLTQFLYTFYTVLVEIGVVAAGSIYTAPIIVFLTVVIWLIQFFYLRTSRQLRLLELASSSVLYTHFTETSTGIHLIRCFQWQKEFLGQLCVLLDRSQRPYYYLFCCQRWLHTVLDFTATFAALIVVGVAISEPGGTSTGAIALALVTIIGFNDTTSFLVFSWTNLETGLGAISRIKSFCLETPSEQDTLEGPEVDEQWPDRGRLDFSCVSVNYKAKDGSSQRVLDNVTFTVFPGEKVAIRGRTGSGKSSLLMTLLRITNFTGSISIDGRNSRSVPIEFLRSRITTLTQDGVELRDSVRFNLYPFAGPKPDDNLVTSILQSVGLWNHINRHGGLDKPLSSMQFSVSQKQLLFLARGMIHQRSLNTRIVIMDEATSAMDNTTDNTLQQILDNAFHGCTVLQIAHREGSFRNTDLNIHLDLGRLVSVQRSGGN